MNTGPQYIKEQAIKAAEHRLRQAATFTGLNIKNPLFQKRMGKGDCSVLVRFEYPGRLTVYDPVTGEQLAASELGHPDVLHPGFVPSIPSLRG
ncbi:MAG: hypothetical protein WCG50_14375 [Rhodoferax sp.]|uniref:hypothetical protein n=1 Tax=Rhodoferax sp. TaxID=50421 RepID=UPI003019DEA0